MARLLLMEDETPFGLELASALRGAGHDVVLIRTASDARQELWHWDFDLLITDMVVRRNGRPVPDGGLGLISWVRQTSMATPGLKRLPIIAMSGEQSRRGMDFLLPTADRIGADLVLEKPFEMDVLLEAITSLVTEDLGGQTSSTR
ncbi:MAG: hypothetical protein AAFY59_05170 [Pseudomonadota bacterium]